MDSINSGNEELNQKVQEWLNWDNNDKTRNEIKDLCKNEKYDELAEIMLNRISFGTAGLRGKMAAGYSCMNDLIIVQTAQGLLRFLQSSDGERLKKFGIVIGYDGRYNSKRWADLSASIFINDGIKVYLFSTVNPTPFVAFALTLHKCSAGIMVTASHNPKEDNGYKLYGWNGAQIVSPIDKNIQKSILANLEPWPKSWNIDNINYQNELLEDPLQKTIDCYMDIVVSSLLREHKNINKQSKLSFIYTAMHGVGYKFVDKAFEVSGMKILPVIEQRDPDPEFPTVKFPNPEEGKSCLDLSIKLAEENQSCVIIANDPDADRLAAAEKNKKSGEWKIFNGNELGALLGWWSLHCYQEKNPNKKLDDVYMLASTVSSKILRAMANAEGFNFIETLTGFKWMGNKAYDLIQNGKDVIFCFEEAIGFMFGSAVLDKDGVSAAVHLATLISYLNHHGLTLTDQLAEIYKEYGYHVSENSYYICRDPVKIKSIFEKLRNFNGKNTYPKGILNGKYAVKSVRDLTTGYDDAQKNNKAILPASSSSQMITFTFENGLVTTLRTSGTEPKIKYYSELCSPPSEKDNEESNKILKEMVGAFVEEFLEPQKNGLIPKSS